MNTFLDSLLTAPAESRTNRGIILWWEKRRILYNLIMLVAGSVTLLIGYSIGQFDLSENYMGILFFAIAANLFYTMGWIVEMALHRAIENKSLTQKAGQLLFIAGASFSVLITVMIDIGIIISHFIGNAT